MIRIPREFFDLIDSEIKSNQEGIDDLMRAVDKVSPLLNQYPQYSVIGDFLSNIGKMVRTINTNFRTTHAISKILALKVIALESSNNYNINNAISEEDRKNLDWLKDYFKHSKGEDSGQ
jgi:hypothetical protein